MTKFVTISITVQVTNREAETIQETIRSDHFEEDMIGLAKKVTRTAGEKALEGYEASLRSKEFLKAMARSGGSVLNLALLTVSSRPHTNGL